MRYDLRYLALAVAAFVLLLTPLRTAIVDDTYIHLQYARNLAEAGELSFNRGDPVYGATSPLWVALLAVFQRAGADILVWCRILSWLFALGSIVLVYRITAALDGRGGAPAAAALILACEAWFLRWTAVGMETSLAAFMVLVVVDRSLSAAVSARRSILLGLALFLAALTRPEALLLVPLASAVSLAARGTRRRFAFLLVVLPLLAAWFALIHRHTGTYFPLTAGAKQGSVSLSPAIAARLLVAARIMGATIVLPCTACVAGVVAGVLARRSIAHYFCRSQSARETPAVPLMLLWVAGLPLAYAVFDFQLLSRYLVPVIPAAVILGVIAWRRLAADLFPRGAARTGALGLFAALVIIQSVFVYAKVVVPPTRQFSRSLETTIAGMGKWLAANSDESAVVATPDIGAIGYYSGRTILDLGGLVSPAINRMRREADVERIIEEGLYLPLGADYLVDRSETPARFAGKTIGGVRFDAVMRGEVPNLGIRKPEPVVYVLYKLEREIAHEE